MFPKVFFYIKLCLKRLCLAIRGNMYALMKSQFAIHSFGNVGEKNILSKAYNDFNLIDICYRWEKEWRVCFKVGNFHVTDGCEYIFKNSRSVSDTHDAVHLINAICHSFRETNRWRDEQSGYRTPIEWIPTTSMHFPLPVGMCASFVKCPNDDFTMEARETVKEETRRTDALHHENVWTKNAKPYGARKNR